MKQGCFHLLTDVAEQFAFGKRQRIILLKNLVVVSNLLWQRFSCTNNKGHEKIGTSLLGKFYSQKTFRAFMSLLHGRYEK